MSTISIIIIIVIAVIIAVFAYLSLSFLLIARGLDIRELELKKLLIKITIQTQYIMIMNITKNTWWKKKEKQ